MLPVVSVGEKESSSTETPSEDPVSKAGAGSDWSPVDLYACVVIALIGGVIRALGLADPKEFVFDETYYAKDSCWYVEAATKPCGLESPPNEVHPPLGKWLIGLGIRVFGFDSFGWRVVPVVAGTITIALLYVLGRKLLHSTVAASIAAGLLALDFLHFVQSRISMLDIFLPMFAVAAFLFLVLDRARLLRSRGDPPEKRRRHLVGRPWRLAAGIAGGAATAVKWSGVFVLLAVIVLTILWEISARRRDGRGRIFRRALREEALSVVLWLLVVPVLVYAVTYVGRMEGSFAALPWTEGSWYRGVWERQFYMLDFHADLDANHTYQSPPWSWILLKRPVSYFFETAQNGDYREIIALGNPFVWWTSLMALAYAAVRWVRARDLASPESVVVGGFLLTYGPWLLLSERTAVFVFYLLPTIPFMCLAIGYVASRIGDSWEAKTAQALFVAGAVGLFIFYFPILAKKQIPQKAWDQRIWIFDGQLFGGKGCDKPEEGGDIVTTTLTTTVAGRISTAVTETRDTGSLPPKGWCWI